MYSIFPRSDTIDRRPGRDLPQTLKKLLALELLRQGTVTYGKAAELLAIGQAEFISFLGEHQVSIFSLLQMSCDKRCWGEPGRFKRSPLINLARIERFDLLKQFYGHVIIPTAVYDEVVIYGQERDGSHDVRNAVWITRSTPVDDLAVSVLAAQLDQRRSLCDHTGRSSTPSCCSSMRFAANTWLRSSASRLPGRWEFSLAPNEKG